MNWIQKLPLIAPSEKTHKLGSVGKKVNQTLSKSIRVALASALLSTFPTLAKSQCTIPTPMCYATSQATLDANPWLASIIAASTESALNTVIWPQVSITFDISGGGTIVVFNAPSDNIDDCPDDPWIQLNWFNIHQEVVDHFIPNYCRNLIYITGAWTLTDGGCWTSVPEISASWGFTEAEDGKWGYTTMSLDALLGANTELITGNAMCNVVWLPDDPAWFLMATPPNWSTLSATEITSFQSTIATMGIPGCEFTPLPLTLTEFKVKTGENCERITNFTTWEVSNIQEAYIQTSVDGIHWINERIMDNISSNESYEIILEPSQSAYIRIAYKETDGKEYVASRIEHAQCNIITPVAFPNPCKGRLKIDKLPGGSKIAIFDTQGKEISNFQEYWDNLIDLSDQRDWMYFLKILFPNGKIAYIKINVVK